MAIRHALLKKVVKSSNTVQRLIVIKITAFPSELFYNCEKYQFTLKGAFLTVHSRFPITPHDLMAFPGKVFYFSSAEKCGNIHIGRGKGAGVIP